MSAAPFSVRGLHHVQLGMPPGGEQGFRARPTRPCAWFVWDPFGNRLEFIEQVAR